VDYGRKKQCGYNLAKEFQFFQGRLPQTPNGVYNFIVYGFGWIFLKILKM